jgi:hypothetical protein
VDNQHTQGIEQHFRPSMTSSRLTGLRPASLLAVLGMLALVLGALVYLLDRGRNPALFSPWIHWPAGEGVFGPAGAWLPTAMHTLAFSLFTALALPAGRAWHWGACAFWLLINALFEWGQHPSIAPVLADWIDDSLAGTLGSEALANYFVHGVFDAGDIVAAAAGALVAGLALHWTHHLGRPRHAP